MCKMKIYKENEWFKKEDGGITGMVIKDGVIASLGVCRCNGGYSTYSIWYSRPGKKDYKLEDDGTISLVEDSEVKVVSKVRPPNVEIKNRKVIPFSKWAKDYAPVHNHTHKGEKYDIKGISVDGLEIRRDGTVKELKITEDHWIYKVDDLCLEADDILIFTYGLSRNDCFDHWRNHAYFNENYDLIFDDDGKYDYNSGYNGDYFGEGKCGLEEFGFKFA